MDSGIMLFSRTFLLSTLITLGLTGLAPPTEAKSVYNRGQQVRFEGRVTGLDGHPLSGLTVALEVSQEGFRLRGLTLKGLKRDKHDVLQVLSTTDSDGRYVIDWSWDPYYNAFELLAALPIEQSSSTSLEVLERVEVTSRVELTNPIVTPIAVEAGAFVRWLQNYLAGSASEDQARIYRELGRPDRLDVAAEGSAAEDGGTSWWYFSAGKVYRFREGTLEQVTHFEPVKEEL